MCFTTIHTTEDKVPLSRPGGSRVWPVFKLVLIHRKPGGGRERGEDAICWQSDLAIVLSSHPVPCQGYCVPLWTHLWLAPESG